MSIYDRTNDLPEEVVSLQKSIDDIKQIQIFGNDNLRIYRFSDNSFPGQTLTAGVTAIFKFTFTFNEPSTSYVLPRYFIVNQTSGYNATFYADPLTVNDITKKSWFYSITVNTTVTNVIIIFNPLCSDSGVPSIVRTV